MANYLSKAAFADGMSKLGLRFKMPNVDLLEAYYQYMVRRFSDEQFIETCSVLFAKSRRFPIPWDFVENAPPRTTLRYDEQDIIQNPYEPVIIRVKKGSQAYRKWQEIFTERDKLGITEVRSHIQIEAGFPSPEVHFVD